MIIHIDIQVILQIIAFTCEESSYFFQSFTIQMWGADNIQNIPGRYDKNFYNIQHKQYLEIDIYTLSYLK